MTSISLNDSILRAANIQSQPSVLVQLQNLQDTQVRSLQTQPEEYLDPNANILTKTWFKILGIYLLVQAIIGIMAIEFAWYRTQRFREKNEKRDVRFPAFRRHDAEKWARWKFYPGAMLVMPTRIVLLLLDGVFLTLVTYILTFGHDFKKGPMKNGCRKWVIFFMYHVCCTFYLFVSGLKSSLSYKDVDYTYYLGPEYKRNMKKIKRTSTIVSNHVSWLDPVVLIKNVRPAFAPSDEFRGVPLLGTLIDVIDSIYIPRGGSEENKAKALMSIRDRQELIEQTGQYAPFLIFAEAGTSNGTHILSLKKGAFFAEKTVRPLYMKYHGNTVNPAFEVMEFLPLAILQLSWACLSCEVTVLPDFQPNEYLFEKHKNKGQERWEIFAWAIRDLMCHHGGFQKCNVSLRKKIEYEAYLQMKPGAQDPENIVIDPESLMNVTPQNSDRRDNIQCLQISDKHNFNQSAQRSDRDKLSDEELFSQNERVRDSDLKRLDKDLGNSEVDIKKVYVDNYNVVNKSVIQKS